MSQNSQTQPLPEITLDQLEKMAGDYADERIAHHRSAGTLSLTF